LDTLSPFSSFFWFIDITGLAGAFFSWHKIPLGVLISPRIIGGRFSGLSTLSLSEAGVEGG
jgi:hypothetical protein